MKSSAAKIWCTLSESPPPSSSGAGNRFLASSSRLYIASSRSPPPIHEVFDASFADSRSVKILPADGGGADGRHVSIALGAAKARTGAIPATSIAGCTTWPPATWTFSSSSHATNAAPLHIRLCSFARASASSIFFAALSAAIRSRAHTNFNASPPALTISTRNS